MIVASLGSWAVLLIIGLLSGRPDGDDKPDRPIRHASRPNWYAKFGEASRAARASPSPPAEPGKMFMPVALTTEVTPRLILDRCSIRPGRPRADTELWIADLNGGRPALLADEPGRASFQLDAAPGSARVAYITGVTGQADDRQALREADLRLAEPGTTARTIASGGVQAPGWSADGKTLFFLKAVAGGWQPYKSVDSGPPLPASGVVFTQAGGWCEPPARFDPGGRLVAGVRGDTFVVADLGSGQIREFRQVPGQLTKIAWAPDSSWLYIQAIISVRMARIPVDQALRVGDGKVVPLNNRLGLLAQPAAGDAIYIVTGDWVPDAGHRLLLFAETRRGSGDIIRHRPGVPDIRESRLLIRDLDRAASTEVVGLPTQHSPVDSSRLYLTPDGRYIVGLGELSLLDGPP